MIEHKENYPIVNGKQSVKLKSGSISFKSYFKQLPVLFKICAKFECILKRVKGSYKNNGSYIDKYQDHISFSSAYKVVCVDNKFSKKVALYKFIKAILEDYDYCKKVIKEHFNKILAMPAKEKKNFN